METRIASLEQSLAALETKLDNQPRPDMEAGLSQVRRQVATLESGIRVQVDALNRQMARLEEKITAVKPQLEAIQTPRAVTVNPEIQEKKPWENLRRHRSLPNQPSRFIPFKKVKPCGGFPRAMTPPWISFGS